MTSSPLIGFVAYTWVAEVLRSYWTTTYVYIEEEKV